MAYSCHTVLRLARRCDVCLRCELTRDYEASHNPGWAGWLRTLTVTALALSINSVQALVLAANSVPEYINS